MKLDHPYVLLLLLVVPALAVAALLAARLKGKQWSEFVAPRLRPLLVKSASPALRWIALALMLAAIAALVIGVARPQVSAGTRTEKTVGRNVMIALDLSRSMRVTDVKPDRLSQAKVAIYELLEAMPNERFGLIGFAGSAYVYAPLTIDRAAVRETTEQIDENWVTVGGSDLSAAVRLAIQTLKETGQKNNALVILSDGEQHSGKVSKLAAEAEQAGVYIVAIGVGSDEGAYVPNPDFPGDPMLDREGRPVVSRMHTAELRELANQTNGRFAIAGSGVDLANLVRSVVDDLDAFEIEARERQIVVEFYQWFTLPAVLFLMAAIFTGTRWRGITVRPALPLALAMGIATGGTARADKVSDARDALRQRNFGEARASYHELAEKTKLDGRRTLYRLGEAEAAYGQGEFRDARGAFSEALRSKDPAVATKGHIGLGNSLFQLGWKSLAEDGYPPAGGGMDVGRFDSLVLELLARESSGAPDDAGSDIGRAIRPMVMNWTDAVRHYESALAFDPKNETAAHNRELTMSYLKRLKELLEQERDDTEQQMPQPESGQEDPQQQEQQGEGGEGEPQDKGKGEDDEQEPQEGDDKEPKDGDQEKEGQQPKPSDEGKPDEGPKDPNESPEDRARRLLKDNADLEKGPLTPGRREFRTPEKDW